MVNFDLVAWDSEEDPHGNVRHVEANGVTLDEVEEVLRDPNNRTTISRSTGRPAVFGMTADGQEAFVVYEILETNPLIVLRPITAYEPLRD